MPLRGINNYKWRISKKREDVIIAMDYNELADFCINIVNDESTKDKYIFCDPFF
jgi:hypothetical protein